MGSIHYGMARFDAYKIISLLFVQFFPENHGGLDNDHPPPSPSLHTPLMITHLAKDHTGELVGLALRGVVLCSTVLRGLKSAFCLALESETDFIPDRLDPPPILDNLLKKCTYGSVQTLKKGKIIFFLL